MKKKFLALLGDAVSLIMKNPLIILPIIVFELIVLTGALVSLKSGVGPKEITPLKIFIRLFSYLGPLFMLYSTVLAQNVLDKGVIDFGEGLKKLFSKFWRLVLLWIFYSLAVGALAFIFVGVPAVLSAFIGSAFVVFGYPIGEYIPVGIAAVGGLVVFIIFIYNFVLAPFLVLFEDKTIPVFRSVGERDVMKRNRELFRGNRNLISPFIFTFIIFFALLIGLVIGAAVITGKAGNYQLITLILGVLEDLGTHILYGILGYLVYREAAK